MPKPTYVLSATGHPVVELIYYAYTDQWDLYEAQSATRITLPPELTERVSRWLTSLSTGLYE